MGPMNKNIVTPDLFVQGLSSKYELQPRCIPHDSNRNSSLLQTNHVANWTALLPHQKSRRFHKNKNSLKRRACKFNLWNFDVWKMFHIVSCFSFWGTHFCRLFSRLVKAFFPWPGILVSDTSVEKKMFPRGPRYTIKIWSCGRCRRWTTFFFLNATPHRLSHPRKRKQVPVPHPEN